MRCGVGRELRPKSERESEADYIQAGERNLFLAYKEHRPPRGQDHNPGFSVKIRVINLVRVPVRPCIV